MQYDIALEMKYKRLRYSHSLAEVVVSHKQFKTVYEFLYYYYYYTNILRAQNATIRWNKDYKTLQWIRGTAIALVFLPLNSAIANIILRDLDLFQGKIFQMWFFLKAVTGNIKIATWKALPSKCRISSRSSTFAMANVNIYKSHTTAIFDSSHRFRDIHV